MNPLFHSTHMSQKSLIPLIFRVGMCLALLVSALTLARPVEAGSTSLTGLLPAFTSLSKVTFTPDSKYVVFMADIEEDERFDLYSVPVTGTVPLKLNPALVNNGDVKQYIILPDSSRVIYTADQELDNSIELYSVPISGGEAVKLNWPLPVGGNVVQMEYDEGTGQVVYMADQDINDVFMLFAVQPTDSITMINLTPDYIAGGTVSSYAIDPVGGRVVWTGKQNASLLFELFSRPILGGPSAKLNPPVVSDIEDFAITPDFAQVVFIARQVLSSKFELFRNSTFGGTAVKRSHLLADGENVLSFRVSPTGLRVVYSVGLNNLGGSASLWGARIASGSPERLTEVADPSYGVQPQDFYFSPDGNRLVYEYRQNAAGPEKLQSVWVSGGPLLRVDLHVPENNHGLGTFYISPDSQMVVFGDFYRSEFLPTLYSVPIAGGSKISLGHGGAPQITPDSQRVIFIIIQPPNNDHSDVMSIQVNGGGERNLSGSAVNYYAGEHVLSPDGKWIVYEFRINSGANYELRVSDGTAASNPPPTPTPPGLPPSAQILYLPIIVK